jgi:hypothetical protein
MLHPREVPRDQLGDPEYPATFSGVAAYIVAVTEKLPICLPGLEVGGLYELDLDCSNQATIEYELNPFLRSDDSRTVHPVGG